MNTNTREGNRWGFKNKTKWILIEEAPLSESGLNEILFAAQTKKELIAIAKLFDLKLTGRNSFYAIVRLEDAHGD